MGTISPQTILADWRAFAAIGRVLQDQARRGRARPIPFLRSAPEMTRFLATFATVAWQDAPGVPPEWNPLTQRILLRSKPLRVSQLGATFEALEYAVTGALHMVHEACHVLAWEPLFVGALPELDATAFVETSMGFEGFCFWYPDIVVAKQLRDRYPNGDVVLARRGASSPHFSPHMAFEALGIESADEIRRLYIDAFSGLHTRLAGRKGLAHPASRSLARRIYAFHTQGKIDIARLQSELERMDLFGGFARRFWLPGLPSALPPDLLARTANGALSTDATCDALVERGLPWIARLGNDALANVAFRRGVQTRAYFAWALRHVLATRGYVRAGGGDPPLRDLAPIVEQLERYLVRLEEILGAVRDAPARVHARGAAAAALAVADGVYQRRIRQPLRLAGLWVRNRQQIFPAAASSLPWGPLPAAHATRRAREDALTRCLEIGRGLAERRRPMPPALAELCRLSSGADRRAWTLVHDRFMTHPEVLPHWSVSLADADPAKGAFRELSFVYH